MELTLNTADYTDYIIGRLANLNSVGEGSILPPRLRGPSRVPSASNIQVRNRVAVTGGTSFTLTWDNVDFDPTLLVDHYNVYYALGGSTTELIGPLSTQHSPATVSIQSAPQVKVTFYIQTVLGNGMSSPLSSALTTASTTV